MYQILHHNRLGLKLKRVCVVLPMGLIIMLNITIPDSYVHLFMFIQFTTMPDTRKYYSTTYYFQYVYTCIT